MTSVIIDTDPGTDDVIALMMALQDPTLDILGITTVGGNANLIDTTRNALRVLEYLDRQEVPVHIGSSGPLEGKYLHAYNYHGDGGITVDLPEPSIKPRSGDAVNFIISKILESSAMVDIIALGPLTNIAIALTKTPALKQSVKQIIVMGGAIAVPGNITAQAEFNIYNDPKAANIVFSSGLTTKLVGLDVCNLFYLEAKDLETLGKSRAAILSKQLLENWFESMPLGEKYSLCDPLAIVTEMKPGALKYRSAKIDVEESSLESLGKTKAYFGEGQIQVAIDLDHNYAKIIFLSMLNGRP